MLPGLPQVAPGIWVESHGLEAAHVAAGRDAHAVAGLALVAVGAADAVAVLRLAVLPVAVASGVAVGGGRAGRVAAADVVGAAVRRARARVGAARSDAEAAVPGAVAREARESRRPGAELGAAALGGVGEIAGAVTAARAGASVLLDVDARLREHHARFRRRVARGRVGDRRVEVARVARVACVVTGIGRGGPRVRNRDRRAEALHLRVGVHRDRRAVPDRSGQVARLADAVTGGVAAHAVGARLTRAAVGGGLAHVAKAHGGRPTRRSSLHRSTMSRPLHRPT